MTFLSYHFRNNGKWRYHFKRNWINFYLTQIRLKIRWTVKNILIQICFVMVWTTSTHYILFIICQQVYLGWVKMYCCQKGYFYFLFNILNIDSRLMLYDDYRSLVICFKYAWIMLFCYVKVKLEYAKDKTILFGLYLTFFFLTFYSWTTI